MRNNNSYQTFESTMNYLKGERAEGESLQPSMLLYQYLCQNIDYCGSEPAYLFNIEKDPVHSVVRAVEYLGADNSRLMDVISLLALEEGVKVSRYIGSDLKSRYRRGVFRNLGSRDFWDSKMNQLFDYLHENAEVSQVRRDRYIEGNRQVEILNGSNPPSPVWTGRVDILEGWIDDAVSTGAVKHSNGSKVKRSGVTDAMERLFQENAVDIWAATMLDMPEWDGVDRIPQIAECFGLDYPDLLEDSLRTWFNISVARCLYGVGVEIDPRYKNRIPQNIILTFGTSEESEPIVRSFVKSLAFPFTKDTDLSIVSERDRVILSSLQDKFIVLLKEGSNLSGAKMSSLKSYLDMQDVTVTRLYDRTSTTVKARFNIMSVYNVDELVTSIGSNQLSGSVVDTRSEKVDRGLLEIDIRQVWAQALETFMHSYDFQMDHCLRQVIREENFRQITNAFTEPIIEACTIDSSIKTPVHLMDIVDNVVGESAVSPFNVRLVREALSHLGVTCFEDVDDQYVKECFGPDARLVDYLEECIPSVSSGKDMYFVGLELL